MTNGTILTSPSSSSHIYVAEIYVANTIITYIHVWCICLTTHSIRQNMFCIRSIFESRHATYKLVVVAGVSQILWSIKKSGLSIQSVIKSNYILHVSRHLLNCLSIDFDNGLLHIPDLDYWVTADVTGQQGMLTPPRHLIPPLIYIEGSVFAIQSFLWCCLFIEIQS